MDCLSITVFALIAAGLNNAFFKQYFVFTPLLFCSKTVYVAFTNTKGLRK